MILQDAPDLLEHDDACLGFCARGLPRRDNVPREADYEASIRRNGGVLADVARELAVSRVTVHGAINRSSHLQKILEQAREAREANLA